MDAKAKQIARAKDNGTLLVPHHAPTTLGFGTVTCRLTLITSNIQVPL